jgi:hypothetical protein
MFQNFFQPCPALSLTMKSLLHPSPVPNQDAACKQDRRFPIFQNAADYSQFSMRRDNLSCDNLVRNSSLPRNELAEGNNFDIAYAKVSLEKLRPPCPSHSMYVASHHNSWAQPFENEPGYGLCRQVTETIVL